MRKINHPSLITTALSLILIVSCHLNEKPKAVAVTGNTEMEYSIATDDSVVSLQFFNKVISDTNSISILLNNKPVPFRLISNELIHIAKDSLHTGKNSFKFIYLNDGKSDTLRKDYFNLLQIDYVVTNTFNHNPSYFTEGLFFDNTGQLIESTGLEGNSKIIFYKPFQNGYGVRDSILNEFAEFGEGVSIVNNQLIQLLWKNKYLKIYNATNHQFMRKMDYPSEGWGLCSDGSHLYASDGTGTIYKIDVSGTAVKTISTIKVQDEGGTVSNINELEWKDGYIFANIWQSDFIYIIDPASGYVISKLDLGIIAEKEKQSEAYTDVLNGIAWNKSNGTLLITGKYWQHFYELTLSKDISKNKPTAIN